MLSYAAATDMTARYDQHIVADLVSDTGAPSPDLTTDPVLAALLSASSGEIDAACTVADQYRPEQLAALAGGALDLLKDLCCHLTMGRLLRRRPGSRHEERLKGQVQWAQEFLEKLRKGQRVFGGAAAQQHAGLVHVAGPDALAVQALNLVRDGTHFFPRRRLYTGGN